MILRHHYHRDLAQASYLLGCAATGEAMIVDPNRDIDQYIDAAEREDLRITKVIETHIHADYVSGSIDLVRETGATLYLSDEGPDEWKYAFASELGAELIHDGDRIMLGNIQIDVIHTPGHTPEHLSFLVTDLAGADQPMGVFTGDFVFVGDVGRPDLLERAAGYQGTMEDGARWLYRSLREFKKLPEFVQIWPGHGAGSACGKSLGAVPQTTVGYERLFNWAFQIEGEDQFVEAVLADQPEPPAYFAEMKRINKAGPTPMSELQHPTELPSPKLRSMLDDGAIIVDTRAKEHFADGHVPGTLNIPFTAGFLMWAGSLVPYDRPFYVIAEQDWLRELVDELRMIGLDNLAGYWPVSVISQWQSSGGTLDSIEQVDAESLERMDGVQVVDVRGAAEHATGHIPESINIPLGSLADRIDELPKDRALVFHCQSGYRSSIASSIAQAHGLRNVVNLSGGFANWEASGCPIRSDRTSKAPA